MRTTSRNGTPIKWGLLVLLMIGCGGSHEEVLLISHPTTIDASGRSIVSDSVRTSRPFNRVCVELPEGFDVDVNHGKISDATGGPVQIDVRLLTPSHDSIELNAVGRLWRKEGQVRSDYVCFFSRSRREVGAEIQAVHVSSSEPILISRMMYLSSEKE